MFILEKLVGRSESSGVYTLLHDFSGLGSLPPSQQKTHAQTPLDVLHLRRAVAHAKGMFRQGR